MTRLGMASLVSAALAASGVVWAGEPPAEPLLRVETGMHTAMINRIGVDAAERFLVTASDDKTARVWDLETGLLLRVLRPPIGGGNEGKLCAAAISRDGAVVAAGGRTAYEWDGDNSIYLFDRRSGRILRRLTDLPNVINHLTFSRDGDYLAATLWGDNGVRVWRTADWRLAADDSDYGDSSYWADFDRAGRLVITSFDGFIRLYNRDFDLIVKKRAPGGRWPFAAAFSPDGERIAVGFADTTAVNVLSGRDLSFLFAPDAAGADNGNLGVVAWSAAGAVLHAGGHYWDGTSFAIRRWADAGRARAKDLPGAQKTIMDIWPLSDGSVAYSAGDPAFGILDTTGHKVLERGPAIADFHRWRESFRISVDGAIVWFGLEYGGKRLGRFSLTDRRLTLDAPDDSTLMALRTETPALEVAGHEIWRSPAPRTVSNVSVSGDGWVAVAEYSDGTIRWHRMTDGAEVLALFPHRDGERWVAWTPEGYYVASPGAEDLIGWHVNNGKDRAADFFSASRFRDAFYRPDIVTRVLETLDPDHPNLALRLENYASLLREVGRNAEAEEMEIRAAVIRAKRAEGTP